MIKKSSAKLKTVSRKSYITPLLIALALITFLTVAYYIVYPSRGFIHSDSTDTILWAQASYDSGRLVSKDFSYAAILPFGGSLLMLPLLPFFGVSMTTQTIGMLLFAVLFFWSVIFLCRHLGFDVPWTSATLFLLILNCSASDKLREMFWGHTIYYSLGMLFLCFALGLACKAIYLAERPERRGYHRTILILFAFSVLVATNSVQVLALCLIPMLGALFADLYLDQERALLHRDNRTAWTLIMTVFLASLLGLLLGRWLQSGNNDIYAGAYTDYSGMETWLANAAALFVSWFSILGVRIANEDTLFSWLSILNVLRMLGGIVLLVLPVSFLMQYKTIHDKKLRLLFNSHLIIAVLVSFLFITGKLYSAAWRLTPVVCSATLFAVAYCRHLVLSRRSVRIAKTILAVLAATAVLAFGTIAAMPPDNTADNQVYQLTGILREHNLKYGYAMFWQANAVTLASNSDIRVRTIEFADGELSPRLFQSQPSWYQDQAGIDAYFLILTDMDYLSLKNSVKWQEIKETLTDEFPALEFQVLVLDQNPFG